MTARAAGDAREPEQHIADVLEVIAVANPQHAAVISGDTIRTWAEFDTRTAALSAVLREVPLSLGGSVGICLRNGNEYLETYIGTLKARGIPTNVNYRYIEDELVALLTSAECEVLVFGASFRDRIAAVHHRLPGLRRCVMVQDETGSTADVPDWAIDYEAALAAAPALPQLPRDGSDPLLAFTGGTTGLPKALSYPVSSRVQGRVAQFAGLLGLPEPAADRFDDAAAQLASTRTSPVGLPASPLMHGTALVTCAIPTLLFGGTVVTVPSASFDPGMVLRAAATHHATMLTLVGDAMSRPLVHELARAASKAVPYRLAALTTITSSGMSWSEATKTGLLEHLPSAELVEVFGATEGLMGMSRRRAGTEAPASPTFTPVAGLRILNDDDTDAGVGEAGRIAFPVADDIHYRGDPEATAAAFRMIGGRRYAVLGDLGRLTPDGLLESLGRGSQVVNTGGEKVYPAEVEDVIRSTPGVADCIVVGLPDERWGQRVVAVTARFDPDVSADDVRAAVRAKLAAFKVPKDVVFVERVPRHPNGKADHEGAIALALPH